MPLDPKSVEGGSELTSGALLENSPPPAAPCGGLNDCLRQQFESAEGTGGHDASRPLRGSTAKTKGSQHDLVGDLLLIQRI